jgi:serine/threonine-protein kinase
VDHAADPLIGRVLDGRYRVGPRIARGGMAAVHEATDLRLDRTVAVKIMHAGLADDEDFVARFEREARSAAKLAHHNVVAVFDQGEDHGTLFLVMEYVPGLTLRDVIRKDAPLSPGKALALLDPVLSALAEAHRAGMIHRDVKPENVLLAETPSGGGTVKVADFGLARAINAETQHTATGGVLIGTVSYLAPELVSEGKADARADVYAAGVLLYEMLTGEKPHQGDSPIQVAYKHVHEDIPPPSAKVPGIPAYVDALVARATARDRAARPADAGVLLHHVRRVRHALEQGVLDDAELTADLTPLRARTDGADRHGGFDDETGGVRGHDAEATIANIPRIVAPAEAVGGAEQDLQFDRDVEGALGHSREELTAPVRATAVTAPSRRDPGGRPPARPVRPQNGPVPPEPPRRGRRRSRLMIAAALALVLLLGLGGWYFGVARYTVTPGVIDLSQAAATAKLEKAGLELDVKGHDYSETVARGAVMSTDPSAGDRIGKHGTVHVVISLGPERHAVPDVKGMTLDDAQAALQDNHLSFGKAVEKYSDKVPENQVITADPAPGTKQRPDTAVDLLVSKGPRPIAIPNYTGKPGAAATKALTKLGFKVSATQDYSDAVPTGSVVSQSPSSGIGHKGDEIALVVSKGPETVQLPDVRTMKIDDAAAVLSRLGLFTEVRHATLYAGLDRVVATTPGPGSHVPRGTRITLIVV